MKLFTTMKKFALPLVLALGCRALALEATNVAPPVTARDFYNTGTQLLAGKKFADAERMFQAALAAQDERVQSPALYNLGHARFAAGMELLKNKMTASGYTDRGSRLIDESQSSLRQAESAILEGNKEKMIEAYLECRHLRHDLRSTQEQINTAIELYGQVLAKWQRAEDDFKSSNEMSPPDLASIENSLEINHTNAEFNAEIIQEHINRLLEQARKMQEMMGMMGKQKQDLGKILSKLKGQIPAPNAPPGAAGDDDEDEPGMKPDSLAGQKENAARQGDQMQIPLSPDQAGQILDGLSLDGSRRLSMSDKEGRPPKNKNGRNW
jgi:tetratricopeptide (TPR) repeat protein